MAISYVKFLRGTPAAFAKLSQKDNDTLYFISETDSKQGVLYLGEKLISKSISNLNDLNNILIGENLQDKNLLSYDANSEKWVNKPVIEAIGIMTGAKNGAQGGAGLVPAPGIGQDGLFLRGDGVWATPVGNGSNVDVMPDEKTISFSNDGITIALKDFGIKYYKYIPETDGEKAHYEVQIVDDSNPWKEGLEAKVTIDDNGQFVLGWFEKDLSLDTLKSKVNEVDSLAKENKNQIQNISNSVKSVVDSLNNKADIDKVYTKTEVDTKILEAGHLTRKTFETLEKANEFANSISNPESYIYMVASNDASNNKYAEYLYIEGSLELIGSWEVNLDNYATKEEVNSISSSLGNLNTRVENLEEFMNSEYFNQRLDTVETDLNSVKEAVTWQDL